MGRRGCGKSTLTKKLLEAYPRKIVIDSLHEYEEGEIVYSFEEFGKAVSLIGKNQPKHFTLVLRIPHDGYESEETVNQVCRIAFELGDVMLVIEEVWLFSNPHKIPDQFKNCLLLGRHQNLAMFFTSQRPGETHKTIISQCNHIFAGQIHEKNDLTYVKSFLGNRVDELSSIPVHSFLYFSQDGQIHRFDNKI